MQEQLLQQHRALLEKETSIASLLEKKIAGLSKAIAAAPDAVLRGADRRGEDSFRALYTINRDGSGTEFLVAAPGMISSSSPEWSHSGLMIAFDAVPEVEALADAHIIVYAVEGPFKGTFRDLGCGNVPSWSPDDRQIVFSLNSSNPIGAEYGVWMMDSDGSNRKWLCEGFYARWSPDGKEICYHYYGDRSGGLAIRDVARGQTRQLLGEETGAKFGGANWSPDGAELVFIALRDGREHLATVGADSDPQSLRLLYSQEDSDRLLIGPPSWSPDGKQIVFAIQDARVQDPKNRRWHHTYLYSLSAEVPSAPVLLEGEKTGLINRSMMWSPDSQQVVFSSER